MEESSAQILITALNDRLRFNKPHRGFLGLLKKSSKRADATSVSQEKDVLETYLNSLVSTQT